MPAQASITVNDGKATPLSHVFAVLGSMAEGGEVVAKWINRSASALTGGAELLFNYYRTKKDGAFTVRLAMIMPITESVSGVNVVTRTLKGTVTFDIPANATAIERKDIRTLLSNALTQVQVTNCIDNGEPIY